MVTSNNTSTQVPAVLPAVLPAQLPAVLPPVLPAPNFPLTPPTHRFQRFKGPHCRRLVPQGHAAVDGHGGLPQGRHQPQMPAVAPLRQQHDPRVRVFLHHHSRRGGGFLRHVDPRVTVTAIGVVVGARARRKVRPANVGLKRERERREGVPREKE
jgi:hypothetical protein